MGEGGPAWLRGRAKASIESCWEKMLDEIRVARLRRGKIRFPQEAHPPTIQSYLATALQPFVATSVKMRGKMAKHQIFCLTFRIVFWLSRSHLNLTRGAACILRKIQPNKRRNPSTEPYFVISNSC